MNCSKILDMFYESDRSDTPLLNQILISIHTFFCPSCAEKINRYNAASAFMKEDFLPEILPESRSFLEIENKIMSEIDLEEQPEKNYSAQGFSTRSWVISGLILLISLVTAFFGLDFKNLASASGMSFMLPMGITIGIILSIYGALFIGSHLKELSERFGL